MEKTVSVFLWVAILMFGTVFITGYIIGEEYHTTKEVYLNYQINYVWDVLVDYKNVGFGKSDVKSVETIGRYYNLYVWKENLTDGGFRKYKQTYKQDNQKLTIELTDSSYGLTGTWNFIFKNVNDNTVVTIEEISINKSILRRGLLYFFDRDREVNIWIKYFKVRLFGRLLSTP